MNDALDRWVQRFSLLALLAVAAALLAAGLALYAPGASAAVRGRGHQNCFAAPLV